MLSLVVLAPMLSVGWFTLGSYRAASDHAESAERLQELVSELGALVQLSSDLAYEGYFSSAIDAVEELGLTSDMAALIVGLDLESAGRRAMLSVDSGLAALGLTDVQQALAEVRTSVQLSPLDRSIGFEEVALLVTARADRLTDEMRSIAGAFSDSGDLDRAQTTVLRAIELREFSATVVTGSLSLRYIGIGEAADLRTASLLGAASSYERVAEDLERTLESSSQAAAAWTTIDSAPEFGRVNEFIGDLSDDVIRNGLDDMSSAGTSFMNIDASSMQDGARAFRDSIAVLTQHVALVDAASEDLGTLAGEIGDRARRDQQMVMVATIAVAVFVVAAVGFGGWWIGAPLLSMSRHVDTIRSGDLSIQVSQRGPREVLSAAQALNEATEHLRLAEAQVSALAREDLDDPILTVEAPGRLGESLQGAVSQLASSLSEREQFRRRLAHESTHDGLTGLLNRPAVLTSIGQGIARYQRSGSELSVLIVDLDGFKDINDRHGHTVGDRVLRETARALVAGVRDGDVVGRLGSDEFVIVAEAVGGAAEAVELAERVRATVAQRLDIDGQILEVDASVGIALASSGSLSADEMMRDADLAVYRAKSNGGHRVEVCDVRLRHELAERASIETEMRAGIDGGEMVVFFQTIHRAADLTPSGAEALVRWRRPDGSLRFPDTFIPVAERSGLIVDLDNAVLDQVCAQLAIWQTRPEFEDLGVSFNVSARHLETGSLVDDFVGRVSQHGVCASKLCVEVTESSILADLDGAACQLHELRNLGAKVAIDDFGTGYTSLAHLRQLPFDVLKIDRSFVANLGVLEDRRLVNMIVDIGHTLGAVIVAEGVESADDAEVLANIGVDLLQGYHFSRPAPVADIETLLMSPVDVVVGQSVE